jgi:hypothetical protein
MELQIFIDCLIKEVERQIDRGERHTELTMSNLYYMLLKVRDDVEDTLLSLDDEDDMLDEDLEWERD